MVIHSENNNPMLVVTRLQRVLEISMWGNIAVEETIDVRHVATEPPLKIPSPGDLL